MTFLLTVKDWQPPGQSPYPNYILRRCTGGGICRKNGLTHPLLLLFDYARIGGFFLINFHLGVIITPLEKIGAFCLIKKDTKWKSVLYLSLQVLSLPGTYSTGGYYLKWESLGECRSQRGSVIPKIKTNPANSPRPYTLWTLRQITAYLCAEIREDGINLHLRRCGCLPLGSGSG